MATKTHKEIIDTLIYDIDLNFIPLFEACAEEEGIEDIGTYMRGVKDAFGTVKYRLNPPEHGGNFCEPLTHYRCMVCDKDYHLPKQSEPRCETCKLNPPLEGNVVLVQWDLNAQVFEL